MRILIWSHWASTALVMVGYICGLLSAANWRLSPVVGTSMVISLAFLQWAMFFEWYLYPQIPWSKTMNL